MIFSRDWWPWTKPGSSLLPGGIATINGYATLRITPSQIIPSAKLHWKISRLDFLRSRWHPPHWLCINVPDNKRVLLLISAGAIKGHFEGKSPREGHQWALVLGRQCPGTPVICNTEEPSLPGNPFSWLPTIFSGSDPIRLLSVRWSEKIIERTPFFFRRVFHCCRRGLVELSNSWILLNVLQKLKQ